MGKKRKRVYKSDSESEDDKIMKKLRKLEKKLRRRRRQKSSTSESEKTDIISENEQTEIETEAIQEIPELNEHETQSNNIDPENMIPLDEEILALLGDPPRDESPIGKTIHADIATRMHDVLLNGLKKECKEKIIEEYPIPGNCQLFKAPILNPEIKAAVSENLHKKDASFAARQTQIGVALTALTQGMQILVADKSEANQIVLKHVSNACRLLCESHYIDTRMRRNLLISTLNNKLKETLKESKRDKTLFGEDLPEKIRANKALAKSSQDLKIPKPRTNFTKGATSSTSSNNLNWKHPQPNAQNQKPSSNTHRTAGSSTRQKNTPARKTYTSSTHRAQTNAHYKNRKRF